MKPRYTDEHRMAGINYRRTDVAATFARIRREQRIPAPPVRPNVTPIKRTK